MKKHIVVLSGAGMSAESGLKTFRDSNGLWEGHDVMQVATPEGWQPGDKVIIPPPSDMNSVNERVNNETDCVDWYFCKKEI